MKRLKRNEEGVSPVIATILMVAITVVLAATLYMMVGDFGGDGDMPLTASISVEDGELDDTQTEVNNLEVRVDSLSEPSSAEVDDLEIRILYDDDGTTREEIIDDVDDEVESYTGRDGDDVVTGTTMYFEDGIDLEDADGDITLDSVELRVDGYDGSTSASF